MGDEGLFERRNLKNLFREECRICALCIRIMPTTDAFHCIRCVRSLPTSEQNVVLKMRGKFISLFWRLFSWSHPTVKFYFLQSKKLFAFPIKKCNIRNTLKTRASVFFSVSIGFRDSKLAFMGGNHVEFISPFDGHKQLCQLLHLPLQTPGHFALFPL